MYASDPVGGTPGDSRLSDESVELIAARFRVVADPSRIRLMEALDRGHATAVELSERLGVPCEAVGLQLEVLFQAGIVREHEQDGGARFALVDWTDWWFVQQMARALEESA